MRSIRHMQLLILSVSYCPEIRIKFGLCCYSLILFNGSQHNAVQSLQGESPVQHQCH